MFSLRRSAVTVILNRGKAARVALEGVPLPDGLYRDLLTFLRERIKEVLTGAGATVVTTTSCAG